MSQAKSHELTFCADAKAWMEQELEARPELVFGRVRIEESVRGSTRKRDLTIYGRNEKIAITGEVKLPWDPEGTSPFNASLVEGAYLKAARVGAEFFVTWNVNRLVLWRTDDKGRPLYDRHIWDLAITQVRDSDELRHPEVERAVRNGLRQFLERASQAVTGQLPLEKRPLDEFFLRVLEASLERPITFTHRAIMEEYGKRGRFRQALNTWMRDVQDWPISDDALIQRDNLERAAKFSCYVLVNRIVFYNALRKRFGSRLPILRVPRNGKRNGLDAAAFKSLLDDFFKRAKVVTKDYETIFDGDFGDGLPFLSDAAVPAWIDLIEQIDKFDFTQLNYDVIGPIFERLISPEERHRYGQHYTKPDIVDVINAFCIRKPEAVVLDPACGGGTFLVRAYSRKKYLAERAGIELPHQKLIDQLFGVDISAYATHLTMLNLATRDLIDERNYPLIAQSDFFDVRQGKPIFHIPLGKKHSHEQRDMMSLAITEVDAVVGNPPYVRQEEISKPLTAKVKGKAKLAHRSLDQIKAEADKYKKELRELIREDWPGLTLSGRSDLHVYFWPHASKFLKGAGYYGFVTSSNWLDAEYGFGLQKFLLENFAIVAILESAVEPWFTGARVATCTTILRREPDRAKRAANLIRFVQLRSALSEILPTGVTEAQRQQAVEALRDRIERISENTVDRHWRVRVVRQEDLYQQGCRGGSQYEGGKWGIPLRAPDLFFEILDRYGERLVPLADIAEVRFGVKSGCDKLFFPRDITERCLEETPGDKDFKKKYGIHRYQTDKIRIVKSGDGSVHVLEAEFLEPEVHNLMEIDSVQVKAENCSRRILVCSRPKASLKETYALDYVKWGERENYHTGATCASRAASRPWYDLNITRRGDMFWPMAQQYRHVIPLNDAKLICNHNLFDIFTPKGMAPEALSGVLNSTLVAMMKHLYGRWAGAEGNLKTEVVDVKMMLVPDPRGISAKVLKRIEGALQQMARRTAPNLVEEFDLADRQELDDAVLELVGESNAARRLELRERLYDEMRQMHSAIRERELQAIENKKRVKKSQRKPGVSQLVSEILNEIGRDLVRSFPADFIQPAWKTEPVSLSPGRARIKDHGLLGEHGIAIGNEYIELGHPERAEFAKLLSDLGRHGEQLLPLEPEHCQQALASYRDYCEQFHAEVVERAGQKTTDARMQARVVKMVEARLAKGEEG
jgi:hypothetical protein